MITLLYLLLGLKMQTLYCNSELENTDCHVWVLFLVVFSWRLSLYEMQNVCASLCILSSLNLAWLWRRTSSHTQAVPFGDHCCSIQWASFPPECIYIIKLDSFFTQMHRTHLLWIALQNPCLNQHYLFEIYSLTVPAHCALCGRVSAFRVC